ncbi:MAG: hypothetical protein NY202_03530 [Mollicutes bacterium UO1]
MAERVELTPENCEGYHQYSYEMTAVKVHICNKCYNPQKGHDMNYFWKKCGINE